MANKNLNILSIDDLESLARHKAAPCVSIFAPLRNGIFKTKEGPVRFSNQLKLARKYLEKDFLMEKSAIEHLLKPAVALVEDHFFWKTPADGVAAFISPKLFRKYRLPVKFGESVTVGNFFDLKPLFPLLMGNEHYYLLVLTKRQAKLFHGTRYALTQIKHDPMPNSADFSKPGGGKLIQSHGISASYRATIFHGHGGAKDAQPQIIEQFCRAVNKEVRKLLMFETAPLVLSAPEFMIPIYQKANGYPNLITSDREIATTGIQERDIARDAWKAVRPYFEKKITDCLVRYDNFASSGKISDDPRKISAAAAEGRVETLFCARDARVWGKIDPLNGVATISEKKTAGDEDLAARAALETFMQKGLVYILSHKEAAQRAPITAIFRY